MRSIKNTEVKYIAQVLISEQWIKISTWYMKRWQVHNSVNMQNTTNPTLWMGDLDGIWLMSQQSWFLKTACDNFWPMQSCSKAT